MKMSQQLKRIVLYCLASLIIIIMILLNIHNEKFSSYHEGSQLVIDDRAVVMSDITGCSTDWTSGYEGPFAVTEWFYMPNSGIYQLSVQADTRSDLNSIELFVTDGRSEKLLAKGPIHSGTGTSSVFFRARSDIKFAQIRIVFSGEGYITVQNVEVYSDVAFNDTYFIAVVVAVILLVLGLYIFVFKKKDPFCENKRECLVDYVVLLVAVIFVSQPTLLGYLLHSHDIMFHLCRIDAIKDALLTGHFPVRLYVSEAYGYGYGAPLYYPDLFLYIPAVFRIFGVSQQMAYTSFLFIINISTALLSYYSAKRLLKDRFAALLASLIYTTALYRLLNIYTRGAIGELIAMVFLPLVVAGIYEVFFGEKKKWWILAVGFSGIIQSHILSLLIVAVFSILFGLVFLFRLFREMRWLSLLKTFGSVIAFNIWFLGPFVEMYIKYPTNFEYQRVTSYLMSTYLSQIFDVFINPYGESYGLGRAASGEMGFSIGLSVIFACAAFFVWLALRKHETKYDEQEKISLCLLVFGAIAVWMTTYHFPLRAIIELGDIGRVLNTIQFPWRILSIATVCFVFPGAVGLSRVGVYLKNKAMVATALVVVIAIPTGYYLFSIQNNPNASEFTGTEIFRYKPYINELVKYGEYLPIGFEKSYLDLQSMDRVVVLSNPDANIDLFSNDNKELSVSYRGGSGYATMPLIYYPGYTAKNSKGEVLEIASDMEKFVQVSLKETEDTITIRYTGLKHWIVYEIISLLSILLVLAYILYKKRVQQMKEESK